MLNFKIMNNTLFLNYSSVSGTNFSRKLFNKRVLEIPIYMDLFNRESNQKKLEVTESLIEQIKKNPERLNNINLKDFGDAFLKIVDTFASMSPIAIHTQISSLNSLVVKVETSKGNIYIEVFFDEVNGWQTETVVNIFKDLQHQFNDSGELDDMLFEITQYFDFQETDYLTYLNQPADYELSGTTFAEADF